MDCANGGGPSVGSECAALAPPPSAFGNGGALQHMNNTMMINGPPSYWYHQQQQQMAAAAANNNGNNDSMMQQQHPHQMLDMPSTSQGNFHPQQHQPGFPQPDMQQQQQFKQFADFQQQQQRNSQQQQHFSQLNHNSHFSPDPGPFGGGGMPNGGNGNGGDVGGPRFSSQSAQMQQQISSPSISSTADLLANGGAGPPGNQGMHQQPFGFGFQPPNGFLGPPNGEHQQLMNGGTFMGLDKCGNPMMAGGAPPMNCSGPGQPPSSFPSPLTIEQQQMMMMAQQQQQQQQRWPPPPPMDRMMLMQNGVQQPPTNSGSGMAQNELAAHQAMMSSGGGPLLNGNSPRQQQLAAPPLPPMMLMAGAGSPHLPFGRRSFLFTSDMANKAAMEVQQLRVAPDMAVWHMHNHQPSTSRACFNQLGQQQQPTSTTSKSSPAGSAPSRSTKRKASAQTTTNNNTTTMEHQQPHSMSSPSQQQHQLINVGSVPQMVPGTPGGLCHPQSVPGFIDTQQQQRHSSVDLCDSSTNGDMTAALFKRPPSRMPSLPNGMGSIGVPPNYLSPNPGQPQTNCFGRLEDENPLRKMEIMTSKTLNETQIQPATKIARMMMGSAVGGGGGNQAAEDQQQQQANDRQEKMRKLSEIEKSLSHFASPDNIASPGAGPPFGGPQQQQQIPPHLMSNGGFCPPGGVPMPPFMPPPGAEQFRPPPPYFPGQMLPPSQFSMPSMMQQQQQQQQNSPSTSSSAPGPPFGIVTNQQPRFPMRMPNNFGGQPPMFCQMPVDGQPMQMGIPPNAMRPNDFSMVGGPPPGCWMPPVGCVPQSLDGLDSRVPSLKMQHLPNGQQQIMAAAASGGAGLPMGGQ